MGFETHDSHILLKRLLLFGILAYIQKDVNTSIVEQCKFFHDLCAKIICRSDLDCLEADTVLVLC